MLFELAIGIPLVISIKKYTCYNMQSVTSNAVAVALDSSISEAITQLKNSMYLQTQRGINVTFEGLASYACGLLMCTQQGV